MYQRNRNLVRRQDGAVVNVARPRGHLFVCHDACCCGRTQDGFAPVPTRLYEQEWERRRFRNFVHLTIGGCLGPCALANVAMLLWEGQTLWFHSVNSEPLVIALFDYIQGMLEADTFFPPAEPLAGLQFTASSSQGRPDGLDVEDRRIYRPPHADELDNLGWHAGAATCGLPPGVGPDRYVADMDGAAAVPRKNGELVFAAPWQGRAFGMAVALSEQECYSWDEFREGLVAQITRAETAGDQSDYYERWLAAFEKMLDERGLVSRQEVDDRTYEFEFGERDEVF
jgi:nitrile hydratase accessory protein